jgi:hypothetical protein
MTEMTPCTMCNAAVVRRRDLSTIIASIARAVLAALQCVHCCLCTALAHTCVPACMKHTHCHCRGEQDASAATAASTPTRRKSGISVTRQSVSLSPPGPAAAAHRSSAPAAADVAKATATAATTASTSTTGSSGKSLKRSQHRTPEKVVGAAAAGAGATTAALIPEVSVYMHAIHCNTITILPLQVLI